jgi:ABC-type nitrate/sulfonate/bicarbonate transport system permease component
MRKSALWGSLILLVVWFLITATGLISRLFLPSPITVLKELYLLILSHEILWDVLATLKRTLSGFLIGCFVGVGIGLIMGYYEKVYRIMEFPVDFFRSIPATALFPLFIVIWGLGDEVKVFVAAWAASMVILINTIYGLRNVSIIRLRVAKIKRASFFKTFLKVIIPDSLSYIFAGFRIALSLALVVEIVAEMFLGSQDGLGRRIFNASSIFQMEEAYAAVFMVGLLGYSLNKMVILLERRVVHWSGV